MKEKERQIISEIQRKGERLSKRERDSLDIDANKTEKERQRD